MYVIVQLNGKRNMFLSEDSSNKNNSISTLPGTPTRRKTNF